MRKKIIITTTTIVFINGLYGGSIKAEEIKLNSGNTSNLLYKSGINNEISDNKLTDVIGNNLNNNIKIQSIENNNVETNNIISNNITTKTDYGNIIEGIYIGNGYIQVGNKKIKIMTRYLSKINKGDVLYLEIKGNINSFKIINITVNGKKINNPNNIISKIESNKSSYNGEGIFNLSGVFSNGFLSYNDNGKNKKIRLIIKNSQLYEGKTVNIKIKGTIKNFKILDIK